MSVKNRIPEKYQKLGIYVHIPFCVKKCDYCDFLSAPSTEEVKREYFNALNKEILSYQYLVQDYMVSTIFIGGGTPSCVDESYILELMNTLRRVFYIDEEKLEATIEVNPGTITKDKLLTYLAAGINRLSFGLQSTSNQELRLLGRIHTYETFVENYQLARELGFHNINIDLMSALPGQSLASWEDTLHKIINLNPEHISAYSLIIEEGTEFYDRYREGTKGNLDLPDEETDRNIYHRTKELLTLHGYERYEISNYAKIGYECAHNISYWTGTEYLGLGLGAASLLNGARFSKMQDIKQYIQNCNAFNGRIKTIEETNEQKLLIEKVKIDPIGIVTEYESLTGNQGMEEFMFLGLRMCKGVSKSAFYQRFHKEIEAVYGQEIAKLKKDHLLLEEGDFLRLSDYGIDISNSVLYVFLLN